MAKSGETTIKVDVNADAFDEWLASIRLLVSQIGFALDNYLASRPSRENG